MFLTNQINANMLKTIKKYIKNRQDDRFYSKLAKRLNMRDYNISNFWEDVANMRDMRYPNPTFVSVYRARKDYGFTSESLVSLCRDNLIRSNNQIPPKYALEDIILMFKVRDSIKETESVDLYKEGIVQGKKKYLIQDIYQKGMSLEKHKLKILQNLHDSLFGDVYHYIPKDISLEEQIERLKDLRK
jgi:hypothetical protein